MKIRQIAKSIFSVVVWKLEFFILTPKAVVSSKKVWSQNLRKNPYLKIFIRNWSLGLRHLTLVIRKVKSARTREIRRVCNWIPVFRMNNEDSYPNFLYFEFSS